MGGRHDKDGIDAQCINVSQLANIPVELIEIEFPIVVEEYALRPDSEGAGKFRGGVGMVRQWRTKADETLVQISADRSERPPWGVAGGGSGAPPKFVVNVGANEQPKPGKGNFLINVGESLRAEVSGAGGWGDPLERDPERVLWDVVDPERRQVDWQATLRLREELRRRQMGTASATPS